MEQQKDILQTLNDNYNLQSDAYQQYQENGFIYLKNVASENEINYARPHIGHGPLSSLIGFLIKDRQLLLNVYSSHKCMETQKTKKFAGIASKLMGVSNVRIYHDQALVKEKGGQSTSWHQDYYYWPLDTVNCLTMWMPLVDCTPDMGTMYYAPGSHKKDLKLYEICEESQDYFKEKVKEYDLQQFDFKAGDATFHSGRLLHSAAENQTQKRREVIAIICGSLVFIIKWCQSVTRGLIQQKQTRRFKCFLSGMKYEEVINTEMNPILL